MKIRQMLVSPSKYNIKCPYSMNATRIVVHNTANDASANNEIKYMISNNHQVSFHVAVDDKEVVQGIPFNRNAWHASDGNKGKGNREGIAIEICYSKSGGDRFIKAEQNAAKLIAQLLKERGWGIDRVTKHQDYARKYCPHRTLDMGWERFLNMVRAELGQASVTVSSTPKPSSNATVTGDITYQSYDNKKKQWLPEVINDRDHAGNIGNALGGLRAKPKYGEIIIQTHIKGGKWLSKISSKLYSKNSKNGDSYGGVMGKPIDGVKIWSTKGYVDYRVHIKGGGWLPWVNSKNANGTGANSYAGIIGKEIDAIQMK